MSRIGSGALTATSPSNPASPAAARSSARAPWWLSPGYIGFAMVVATATMAVLTPEATFRREWGTRKYFTGSEFREVLLLTVAFAIPSVLQAWRVRGGTRRRPNGLVSALADPEVALLRRSTIVLYRLALLGYVVWGVLAIARGLTPTVIVDYLASTRGAAASLKDEYFATVPGVTTLSTLGLGACLLAVIIRRHDPRLSRRVLVVMGVLTAARAVLRSERLALVELALVVIVIVVAQRANDPRPGRRMALWRWAPVLFVPALLLLFAGLEYFKSWSYYSEVQDRSLVAFATVRLEGYYSTAYNNFVVNDRFEVDTDIPYRSLEALWQFPPFEAVGLYEAVSGEPRPPSALERYANPEFNNPSGIGTLLGDFGVAGGFVVCLVLGFLASRCYFRFWYTGGFGALLYPLFFVAAVELPRVPYLSATRVAAPIVALLIVDRARVRARARRARPIPAVVGARR